MVFQTARNHHGMEQILHVNVYLYVVKEKKVIWNCLPKTFMVVVEKTQRLKLGGSLFKVVFSIE